jgi:hypothetical protein
MGAERSYRVLADRYGVSKTAIVKRAKKEQWQDRIAKLEREARKRAEEKAIDELEAVRQRQLKESRFLQARAIQVLKDQPPEQGIRAATALNIAWKHEMFLLGEPSDRTVLSVEAMRERFERWTMEVEEGDEPTTTRKATAEAKPGRASTTNGHEDP